MNHVEAKHLNVDYVCGKCIKSFRSRNSLKTHVSTYHSVPGGSGPVAYEPVNVAKQVVIAGVAEQQNVAESELKHTAKKNVDPKTRSAKRKNIHIENSQPKKSKSTERVTRSMKNKATRSLRNSKFGS